MFTRNGAYAIEDRGSNPILVSTVYGGPAGSPATGITATAGEIKLQSTTANPVAFAQTAPLVGAGLAVQKGEWFFDRIDEIYRRSSPHTPERFLRECKAMSAAAYAEEAIVLATPERPVPNGARLI